MNDPDLAYKQRKIDEALERWARYGPNNQGQIRGLLQEAIENVEDGFDPTVIVGCLAWDEAHQLGSATLPF